MIPAQSFAGAFSEGAAIVIVGMLFMLLWASVQFRNPLAVVGWVMSVTLFVFTLLFDVGIEIVWLAVIATAMLVAVGVLARWMQ